MIINFQILNKRIQNAFPGGVRCNVYDTWLNSKGRDYSPIWDKNLVLSLNHIRDQSSRQKE